MGFLVTRLHVGRSGFRISVGARLFLPQTSRPDLRPTQPNVQWLPGVKSLGATFGSYGQVTARLEIGGAQDRDRWRCDVVSTVMNRRVS